MIYFFITKHGSKFPLPTGYENAQDVYSSLCHWCPEMEAENAQGWCELAAIGEVYHGSNFDIEVEEY